MTSLNYGFALLGNSGIFLKKYKEDPQLLQYQLYDFALGAIGNLTTLKGKTLVEVGCGRGGCFRYIVNEY